MLLYIVRVGLFPARSNIYLSSQCFWYSTVLWRSDPIHFINLGQLSALSSVPSQVDVLSSKEGQWSQCDACTVAMPDIFSSVDWNLGPFHFIPWCVLREAVASVFSGSCHAPSHHRGKLAACVGSDRMTALQGWTVKQCGQLAWLPN